MKITKKIRETRDLFPLLDHPRWLRYKPLLLDSLWHRMRSAERRARWMPLAVRFRRLPPGKLAEMVANTQLYADRVRAVLSAERYEHTGCKFCSRETMDASTPDDQES